MKITDSKLKEIYQKETTRFSSVASQCPSPDQLYLLHLGKLNDKQRQDLAQHLAICSRCSKDYRIVQSFSDSASQNRAQQAGYKWLLAAAAVVIVVLSVVVYRTTLLKTTSPIKIAFTDIENLTGDEKLDAISGLLTTSLEQSKQFKVIPRSYMYDAIRMLGKNAITRIDEGSAKKIAATEGIDALALPSIWNMYGGYMLRLVLVDTKTNKAFFSLDQKIDNNDSIVNAIDGLVAKVRLNQKDDIRQMQKISEITTSNLAAYERYFRGERLLEQMEFEKAEQEFQRAIQLDPEFALAYYKLAFTRWSREEVSFDAIQHAMMNIHRAPVKEKAQIRAYHAYLNGDSHSALEIYQQLNRQYPEDKDVLYMIGDLSFHEGNYPQAEKFMMKVLAKNPDHPLATDHLLWTFEATGRLNDLLLFSKQYTERSGSLRAYKWQGDALNLLGDFHNAHILFQRTQKLFPESVLPTIAIAEDVFVFREQYSEAESRILTELKKRNDKSDQRDLHRSLSRIQSYQGRYHEVIDSCDRVIALDMELKDDMDLARAYAQKAFWLIVVYENYTAANEAITKAKKVDHGKDAILYSYLLTNYLLMGNRNEALVLSREKLFGYKWGGQLEQAITSGKQGLCQTAAQEFARMEREGERLAPILRAHVAGITFYECKHYENSLKMFEKIQKTNLNYFGYRAAFYATSYYYQGLNFEQLNRPAEAIGAYQHFLHLWKDADSDLAIVREAKRRFEKLSES